MSNAGAAKPPGDGGSLSLLRTLIGNLSLPVVRFPSTPEDPRRASVAAVLRVRPRKAVPADLPVAKSVEAFLELDWVKTGTCQLLFVQRALNPNDTWSGDVAFVGGKRDPSDASDREVAERETREEIGLDLTSPAFACLGELDEREVKSFSGEKWLTLCCFVYLQLVPVTPEMTLQTTEIATAFWVPLALLHDLAVSENTTGHERWYLRSYQLADLVLPTGHRRRGSKGKPQPLVTRIAKTILGWTVKILFFGFGTVSFGGIHLPVEDDEYVDMLPAEDPTDTVMVGQDMSASVSREHSDDDDNVVVSSRSGTSTPPSELAESQWEDLASAGDPSKTTGSLLARHPPHSDPILWGLTLWMASDLADLLFKPNEVPGEALASKSRSLFSAIDINLFLNLLHPHQRMQRRKPMIGFDKRDESGAGEAVSLEEQGVGEFKDPVKNRLSFGSALRLSVILAFFVRSAAAFLVVSRARRLLLPRLLG